MNHLIFNILAFFIFPVFALGGIAGISRFQPDTIPPPPPGPAALSGPESACYGDTSVYSAEAPVASVCQWTINGAIQPDTAPSMTVIWAETGDFQISVVFLGPGGEQSDPQTVTTYVGTALPSSIQGPATSCQGYAETYTTTIGPGEICRWKVDGVQQATTSPTLTITWNDPGSHMIEVRAEGPCGTGDPVYKNVVVQVLPEVFLGNDTILQPGQTILLDAGHPGSSYLWSTGATTQTLLVTVTGTYAVTVSNFCGIDADEINVTILVSIPEVNPDNPFITSISGLKLEFLQLSRDIIRIEIADMNGRMIYQGIPADKIVLPQRGIYILRALTPNKIFTRKIRAG